MEKAINFNSIECDCSDGISATSWCVECIQFICVNCVNAHQRVKTTKNHVIKNKQEVSTTFIKCTSCPDDALASSWCFECSEFICVDCANAHQRMKMTRGHTIKLKEIVITQLADAPAKVQTVSKQLERQPKRLNQIITETVVTGVCDDSNNAIHTESYQGNPSNQIMPENSKDVDANSEIEFLRHDDVVDMECDPEIVVDGSKNLQPKQISLSPAVGPLSKWFNLSKVLNDTTDGKMIINYYNMKGIILPKHKKRLINIILDKIFNVRQKLTFAEREEIAQQISFVFHNERKSDYIRKEPTAKGIKTLGTLEAAYNYRRGKVVKKVKKYRKNAEDAEVEEIESPSKFLTDEVKVSLIQMQKTSLNEELEMTAWNKSFQFRNAKMSDYNSFDEIFTNWPYLCGLNGLKLIDNDFQKMFAVGDETKYLSTKWCDFVELNLELIMDMICDPAAIAPLATLNMEQGLNEKSLIVCMALFHLPINIPAAFGFGENRWRPTILSSKNSVFKRVYSKTSIAKAIKARNCERTLRDIKEHPIIYGVGETFDEMTDFYVGLGEVLFQFSNFLEALDASFKCFKVLKQDYPKESYKFWNFIDLAFYKTKNEEDSAVMAVINSFK